MLREFVEKKHVKFADSAPDWREAIRMSCEVLEADGTIEENYKEDIIACVEKYGPCIVIAPNIAMPHSQEGAKGVLQNMSRLSEMLMNEELVEELADVETEEDLLKLQEKYLDA